MYVHIKTYTKRVMVIDRLLVYSSSISWSESQGNYKLSDASLLCRCSEVHRCVISCVARKEILFSSTYSWDSRVYDVAFRREDGGGDIKV